MELWTLVLGFVACVTTVTCQDGCENGNTCLARDGNYGVCVAGTCMVIESVSRPNLKFEIVVKYPEETLKMSNGTDLYLRGNALGFNWKKGTVLNKTDPDTWRIMILYHSDAKGFRCQNCAENNTYNGEYFLYRIYIDDVTDMIGGNLKVKLPTSKSSSYFDNAPEFFAFPWFFTREGKGDILSIHSPQLGREFDIVIHKPPSFEENPFKSYPTMMVLDLSGDAYNMSKHSLDKGIVELETSGEYIAVGFGDFSSEEDRVDLLSQVPGMIHVCINGSFADRCSGCLPVTMNTTEYFWYMDHGCGRMIQLGGRGNDTLDFLVDTVLPKVRQLTNLRMRINRYNLGIMGFSLGGLLACHAAWTRPSVFGMAACQSPSFWWPAINSTKTEFYFTNVTLAEEQLRKNRPTQKIYLDVGGQETELPFAMTQTTIAVAENMVAAGDFTWDENIWAFVFPDHMHTSLHWAMRLWNPLKLLFPSDPTPRIDEDERGPKCEDKVNGYGRTCLHNSLVILYGLFAVFFKHI